MQTLGLRHLALNVSNPQVSKEFYTRVLKMTVEWEPDPDNIYLTSEGLDNLALHKANMPLILNGQALDHFGFMLPTVQAVDEWYHWIKSQEAVIAQEIKTHRDGARSFYFKDPDGIIIQMIYHPPIAQKSNSCPVASLR